MRRGREAEREQPRRGTGGAVCLCGGVAKWQGIGLAIRDPRFDSGEQESVMAHRHKTGTKAASAAAKVLSSKSSTKAAKTAAGSALSQKSGAKSHPKKRR